MRLGYFTMPVHAPSRPWMETLREDREAVILADQLGFHDAFVGEHLTDQCENITNSMLFLATLIHSTHTIKLATGTSNLPQTHPVLIAANAAMFDHLSGGRFILGISPGALAADAEALGILGEDRNKLFSEAIDVILEIWRRDAPYDIDLPDNRFKVSTRQAGRPDLFTGILPKPLQRPWPEIVGTVSAPFSQGVVAMGAKDFHPLSANFLLPQWLKSHWTNYAKGKASVNAVAEVADWRVARTIFVADDDATARRYARSDANSPYLAYYKQLIEKLLRSKTLGGLKVSREQADEDVKLDDVMDSLVIYGSVDRVVDQILQLEQLAGPFGEIVYVGTDWTDATLAKRSMVLMAEQVLPRVNAALAKT